MTALKWITTEAKKLKKKYPKKEWKDLVKQASAMYAAKHKGKSPVGKKKTKKSIGAVKKKATKKVATKTHKDTKNHNVNIRVVSGTVAGVASHGVKLLEHKISVAYAKTLSAHTVKERNKYKKLIATYKKQLAAFKKIKH